MNNSDNNRESTTGIIIEDNNYLSKRWNTEVQTPHGGQEWRELSNFIEDFSITTNPLGPPSASLAAGRKALDETSHYPPSDFEPAWSELTNYIFGDGADTATHKQRVLLGNGASEMIDIAIRYAAIWKFQTTGICHSNKWRPGSFDIQYMEYQRCAEGQGRRKVVWNDASADLICIVNPCNPTGEYSDIDELKTFISTYTCQRGNTIIIDESMLPFKGLNWQESSIAREMEWAKTLAERCGILIIVIHSWTKIFACPGLRIGSLITPLANIATQMRKMQVPWSLNTPAIAFLVEAVKDLDFMKKSSECIVTWRHNLVSMLKEQWPEWTVAGVCWQPFVWIDTNDVQIAKSVVAACSKSGVPIRWLLHGYGCPTCIRIAVRQPDAVDILRHAISKSHIESICGPQE